MPLNAYTSFEGDAGLIEFLGLLNYPKPPGYINPEVDDVIGSVCTRAERSGYELYLVVPPDDEHSRVQYVFRRLETSRENN